MVEGGSVIHFKHQKRKEKLKDRIEKLFRRVCALNGSSLNCTQNTNYQNTGIIDQAVILFPIRYLFTL